MQPKRRITEGLLTLETHSTRYTGMRPAADEHVNAQSETTDLFTHELHAHEYRQQREVHQNHVMITCLMLI